MKLIQIALAQNQTLKDVLSESGTKADLSSVMDTINIVIKLALALAGIIGVIMIMYASVLYVLSFGDEGKAETAKKTLLWSIVGLAFVGFAELIVYLVDVSL